MIAARRTRLTLITLAATVMITITVVAYVALPHYNYWRLTGSWSPIKIIEKLESPVPVRGWSEDRLLSADGQTILLPGFRKLPKTSKALFEATKRGVEITPDGLVVGLVRVHHWCGNDPVEEHITR